MGSVRPSDANRRVEIVTQSPASHLRANGFKELNTRKNQMLSQWTALRRPSVVLAGAAGITVGALLIAFWPSIAAALLSTRGIDVRGQLENFEPHGHCYLWMNSLLWLHAASDMAIGVSYFAISTMLIYLVARARGSVPFHWMFVSFGVFIVACGITHLMEVWITFLTPVYWLAGYIKLITAVASVLTALVLPVVIPQALAVVEEARVSNERRLQLEDSQRQLQEAMKKVEAQSLTDALTGLNNRRAWARTFNLEFDRVKRYGMPLSVLIIDVDHFKSFNDKYGHQVGDDLLRDLSRVLEHQVRATDFVARFGGEEFVVLLPNTSGDGALILAERVREAVQLMSDGNRSVTISVGLASFQPVMLDSDALLSAADQALYRAKNSGRNRVVKA